MKGTKTQAETIVLAPLKYSISSKLNMFSTAAQSQIKRKVMRELEITEQTYYRWLRIEMTSKSEIPYRAMTLFASILEASHTDLLNNPQ